MGRLVTSIAAAVTDADNLPSSQKLPKVSFIDALLPRSLSTVGSPRKEQEPLGKSPSQKTYVTYYEVKKDNKGRKSIIAHKSPLGSAAHAGGDPANDKEKNQQGEGKRKGKGGGGEQKDEGGQKENQQGKKGGKNKQKKDNNENDHKDQKKGDGGDKVDHNSQTPNYHTLTYLAPKNPQTREWAAEEDNKLKELWAANTPLKQIARQLKRPQKQCEERYNEIKGEGAGDKDKAGGHEKKAGDGDQPKLTKAQKRAAKRAADEAAKSKDEARTKNASSKARSAHSNGEARFTMGEWLTLQEDALFSFGELQCLGEIIMKDQKQTWARIAAKFYDLTGRRVHPDDIREKFEGMAGMG